MYCIINHERDIIAGDKEFFTLLGTKSLMELYGQISNGETSISFDIEDMTVTHFGDIRSYPLRAFELDGLLSSANIIEILPLEQDEEEEQSIEHTEPNRIKDEITEDIQPIIQEEKPLEHIELTFEDNSLVLDETIVPTETIQMETKATNTSNDDYDILELLDLAEESQPATIHKPLEPIVAPIAPAIAIETAYINLPILEQEVPVLAEPIKPEITFEPIEIEQIANKKSFEPIEIDTLLASQKLGISQAEYASFFEEYIQTIETSRDALLGENQAKKQSAINFIAHLSDALYLTDDIHHIISQLTLNSTPEQIDDFYHAIDKVTINNQQIKEDVTPQTTIKLEIQIPEIETNSYEAPQKATSIDLSNVTPVKFDFILDEAVKELSLPKDIVKEFIVYFIEQSHTEIETMLDAHKNGDLEKIKRSAHTLKGVASNLYITALAKSLSQLQYNEEIDQVEPLVKAYWAKFISFENLMNNI